MRDDVARPQVLLLHALDLDQEVAVAVRGGGKVEWKVEDQQATVLVECLISENILIR